MLGLFNSSFPFVSSFTTCNSREKITSLTRSRVLEVVVFLASCATIYFQIFHQTWDGVELPPNLFNRFQGCTTHTFHCHGREAIRKHCPNNSTNRSICIDGQSYCNYTKHAQRNYCNTIQSIQTKLTKMLTIIANTGIIKKLYPKANPKITLVVVIVKCLDVVLVSVV